MSSSQIDFDSQVAEAIENAPHLSNQRLRFETTEGHVTLRGTVGSYFHKQMAQEAVLSVEGVEQLDNEVVVHW